jgi:hypothetical protein
MKKQVETIVGKAALLIIDVTKGSLFRTKHPFQSSMPMPLIILKKFYSLHEKQKSQLFSLGKCIAKI